MTETDYANVWGEWLAQRLEERGWRQADLVHSSGGLIKRDRASKWVSGNERPSYRLAIVAANTLGVPHEAALEAAGYAEPSHDVPAHIAREHDAQREFDQSADGQAALKQRLAIFDFARDLDQFTSSAEARMRVLQAFTEDELLAEIKRRFALARAHQANVPTSIDDLEARRPRTTARAEAAADARDMTDSDVPVPGEHPED